MDTIRTTISLPSELHEELRIQAVREKKSVGRVIAERLRTATLSGGSLQEKIEADVNFFKKVARGGKKVNLVAALREERSRDS